MFRLKNLILFCLWAISSTVQLVVYAILVIVIVIVTNHQNGDEYHMYW